MPISNETVKQNQGVLSRFGMNAKKWVASFVAPASEIKEHDVHMFGGGMTTVASLLSSGNRLSRSRPAIYDKWAQMEGDPVVSTALGLLVTSALGGHETSGELVFIEKSAGAQKDKRLAAIAEEISKDLSPMFNRVAYQMAYTGAAFGDAYARIYADSTGVIDLYTDELVRPQLVQPYERGSRTVGYAVFTGKKNFEKLDISQMARLKMPRAQWIPQHGVYEKSMRLAISEDDLHELPVLPAMVGGSLLYNAEDAYDNFSASLIGLVGQRWIDSVDEQMLGVNLDSMTKEQQEAFMASVEGMLKRSKAQAEAAVKNNRPVLERIRHILPMFNEKQLISMGGPSQSGRTSNLTTDDIMLHARLLSGSLGVDLSMLGFADQMAGGLGDGGFFRVSAQVAERARVIRVALSEFFNKVVDIHTMRRYGVVFDDRNRPWTINFFGSISALESEKQRTRTDAMNSGLLMVQAMQLLKELGASKEIMTEFLSKSMMLDEDQAKLYAKIVDAPIPGDEGMGGGFGGGDGFGGEPAGEPAPPKRLRVRKNFDKPDQQDDEVDSGDSDSGDGGGGE